MLKGRSDLFWCKTQRRFFLRKSMFFSSLLFSSNRHQRHNHGRNTKILSKQFTSFGTANAPENRRSDITIHVHSFNPSVSSQSRFFLVQFFIKRLIFVRNHVSRFANFNRKSSKHVRLNHRSNRSAGMVKIERNECIDSGNRWSHPFVKRDWTWWSCFGRPAFANRRKVEKNDFHFEKSKHVSCYSKQCVSAWIVSAIWLFYRRRNEADLLIVI